MPMDKKLITAYQNAEYVVFEQPEFVMHVNQYCQALYDLMAVKSCSQAAFITADNPFSKPLCESQNADRHAALKQELLSLDLDFVDGVGRGKHGNWPAEKSFLVLGVNKHTATELGKKFEQNAILWIEKDAVPKLVFIDAGCSR